MTETLQEWAAKQIEEARKSPEYWKELYEIEVGEHAITRKMLAHPDGDTDWKALYFALAYQADQELGAALGYPWYKDDQKNFPGATEAEGVCTGEHVPESIISEAAEKLKELRGWKAWYDSLVDKDMRRRQKMSDDASALRERQFNEPG